MIFGPDRYKGNLDQNWAALKAAGASFAILKVTEGASYDTSWYRRNLPAARAAGLVVGHYHFLRWDEDGMAQWEYFKAAADLRPGDVIPWCDFESGGEHGVPLPTGQHNLMLFLSAAKADGYDCGIYGHASVAATGKSWAELGAAAYWVPGDTPHTDCGPPDLWQYAPYTRPAGYPWDGDDWSVVLTHLPLIGGDDLATLTDDQQKFVQGMIRRVNRQGQPPADADPQVKAGFAALDAVIDEAMGSPKPVPGPPGKDGKDGAPGTTGKVGVHYHDFGGHTSPGKAAP